MATDQETLLVNLSADFRQFQRAMVSAAGEAQRAATRIERSFEQSNARTIRGFQSFADNARNVIATIGVGLVVRDVVQLADVWTRVGNQLSMAGVEADRLATAQQTVADIALRTNSNLEATGDLFARMLRSSNDLGASMSEVAAVTEIVSKALAGASQSERASAIRQLGQGLGSGRLQGDELRSILENSRAIAEAIAAEFETTVGNLRELGKTGQLESARVFRAILNAGEDIDEAFNRTSRTVEDSFVRLRTAAARFIGTNEQTAGSVRGLTRLISFVADNFDTLADATVIAATVLGGSFAGLAVGRAVDALLKLQLTAASARNALAFFGGPLGLALTVAGAAFAYVATQTDLLTSSQDALTRQADSSYTALQRIASLGEDLAELADAGEAAADQTGALAQAGIDAREALDGMADSSGDVSQALSIQGRLATAMATIERDRTIATLASAAADSVAAIAAIRRERVTRSLMEVLALNATGGQSGAASLGALFAGEDDPRIAELEEQRDLYQGLVSTIEGLDISTWQALVDAQGEGLAAAEGSANATARERSNLAASHELTMARLYGDILRIQALEDAAAIEERTAAYVRAGTAAEAARAAAIREVGDERQAQNAQAAQAYEIARQQHEIELERIAGNISIADALSDQLDILQMTTQIQQQLSVSLEVAAKRARDFVEARREALNIEREYQLGQRDLENELEIARARGDSRAEAAILRRQELEGRISELRRLGVGEEAAAERARAEIDALEQADMQGHFRDWFRGGMRAAIDGDFGDYFQSWLAERAGAALDEALNSIADIVFDVFNNAVSGALSELSDGAGGTLARIFGGEAQDGLSALGSASAEAAATMKGQLIAALVSSAAQETASSAIKSASAAKVVVSESLLSSNALKASIALAQLAAAAKAAAVTGGGDKGAGGIISAIFSLFGGGRAAGGPVSPGNWYNVGENGPERFVPGVPGVIVPNNKAMGGGVAVSYVDKTSISIVGASTQEVAQLRAVVTDIVRTQKQNTIAIIRDAARRPRGLGG